MGSKAQDMTGELEIRREIFVPVSPAELATVDSAWDTGIEFEL